MTKFAASTWRATVLILVATTWAYAQTTMPSFPTPQPTSPSLTDPWLPAANNAAAIATMVAPWLPYGLPPGHPDGAMPVPQTGADPLVYGSWSPVVDWAAQIQPTGDAEIAHAVLIPTGPERGNILMWNVDTAGVVSNFWIFDQTSPLALREYATLNQSNVFCSGQTIRPNGDILIPGGLNISPAQPTASYLVSPVIDNEFVNYPMAEARYYPTAIPLTNTPTKGRSFVLGGAPSLQVSPLIPGQLIGNPAFQWEVFDDVSWTTVTPSSATVPVSFKIVAARARRDQCELFSKFDHAA